MTARMGWWERLPSVGFTVVGRFRATTPIVAHGTCYGRAYLALAYAQGVKTMRARLRL